MSTLSLLSPKSASPHRFRLINDPNNPFLVVKNEIPSSQSRLPTKRPRDESISPRKRRKGVSDRGGREIVYHIDNNGDTQLGSPFERFSVEKKKKGATADDIRNPMVDRTPARQEILEYPKDPDQPRSGRILSPLPRKAKEDGSPERYYQNLNPSSFCLTPPRSHLGPEPWLSPPIMKTPPSSRANGWRRQRGSSPSSSGNSWSLYDAQSHLENERSKLVIRYPDTPITHPSRSGMSKRVNKEESIRWNGKECRGIVPNEDHQLDWDMRMQNLGKWVDELESPTKKSRSKRVKI